MKFDTSDQGFTFGGRHSDELDAFLIAYSIPPSPGTIDNELVVPGRDGPYDAGTDLTRLDLTMQVGLWVPDSGRKAINIALRQMMALFDPRAGYQQLSLDEDPDFFLLAKLTSTTGTSQLTPQPLGTNGEMAAVIDLSLKCSDPHWYSYSQGARTVPAGEIGNPGSAPTPVVITLTAVGASLAEVNKGVIIDGEEVGYNGAMNNGDTVVINTDTWTATKAGANAITGWYGEMPLLPGGDSEVTVVGPCTAQITYTPRWLA